MTAWDRIAAWSRRNLPTRESMERSRLLRPVAHRVLAPELWRFTRRSVPRGVALGMVAGILFPVAQIAIAALIALPFRANVPVAALVTFITNPFTTPFILFAAYQIGAWLLRANAPAVAQPVAEAATGWLQWLWDAGPPLVLGLLVLTLVAAVFGYALAALGWRLWIARKWRHRHEHRRHGGCH
ncbi:DUF2062 domain-containing protein [Sphingomonas citri]|jgi:uncharacterized protein|uniref:DUF2062 domain-containing protein n=1 Tax=Sphingomonas citri TaxID=2862499 RepID=A0ABS7BQJ5_9SPHN|nr:DUF2062 domain-containing protein [Sphingomonas citri]MBW6531877.1 DUF2062 domain-containing protein [Sphingomonas citri]